MDDFGYNINFWRQWTHIRDLFSAFWASANVIAVLDFRCFYNQSTAAFGLNEKDVSVSDTSEIVKLWNHTYNFIDNI